MADPAAAQMTPSPTPVYLDCDTGIDDALALGYLLASPAANLVGVGSVHGNVSASGGAENTRRLLAMAGRTDIPVTVGAVDPLVGSFAGGAVNVHGQDGVGEVRERLLPALDSGDADTDSTDSADPVDSVEDAADLLIRLSHEYAGALHVIAIGPLTNLAFALERDPSLVERIAHVTIMGGAAMVPGNVAPLTEANIGCDPEAAQDVVSADWQITLVPLDTTMANTFELDSITAVKESSTPFTAAVGEMLDYYSGFYADIYGRTCCALHDPLAAAIAVGEVELVSAPRIPVQIDTTNGPGRGQTECDLRHQRPGNGEYDVDVDGANVRVVLISADGFPELLLNRMLQL